MKNKSINKNEYNAPNEVEKLLIKANKYFSENKYERVIDICKELETNLLEQSDDNQCARLYFAWVMSLMQLNDYASIDAVLDKAKTKIGHHLDYRFLQIMTAFGNQRFEETVELVDQFHKEHSALDPVTNRNYFESYDSLDEILWLGAESAGKYLDLGKMLVLMEKAVDIRPEKHNRRVEYAMLLAKDNRDERALDVIEDGIEKYSDVVALRNARSLILSELERFEEAENAVREIIAEYPDNLDAVNNLGVIYDKQGKYEQAKKQFAKALELSPDNITASNNLKYLSDVICSDKQTISVCMMVKDEEKFLPGCLESIKGLFDELIVVDTGSADRTMDIARDYGAKIYEHPWQNDFSLHRNQSIDYATCDWILIIDADEELDPAEHSAIRQAVKRKDIESISFVVYNKIQMGRVGFLNSQRMFRNHKGYKYHGIVHNQLEVEGKTLMSNWKVIHHGYGLTEEQMQKKGRRSEALLLKQLEDNPDLVFPHFNLAQIYRGLSEPEKSLEHAKIVAEKISIDDMDHRHVLMMALDQIGCAYLGLDQPEKAEETFKKALEYKEDYLDPMFNLGFLYMRQQRYDEAEEIFNRYMKKRKEYSPNREWMGLILNNLESQFAVNYALGFISFLRGEINAAFNYFQEVLQQTDDFEYLHHFLARYYREIGKFDMILKHCEQAVEFGHEDADIRILEGEALLNLGYADAARKSFKLAIEFDPDLDDPYLGLVGADSIDKAPAEVLQSVDKFLEKSPTSPQGLATRGEILFEMGEYTNAKETYKKTFTANPNDYKVCNNLGNCFFKDQNFASAEFYYLRALQINRNFLAGYRNLASALIKQGKFDDAVEYLEFYHKVNPEDYRINATLADIYYNKKEYQKAIAQYEKYLSGNPTNNDALIRISDCYFNLGKLESALAGYKMVLKRDSENQTAKNRVADLNAYAKPVEA